MNGAGYSSLQNSTIKDASYGLLFTNSGNGWFSGNSFRNNYYGVYASSYSNPTITQTGFRDNVADVIGDNTSVPDLGSSFGNNAFRSAQQVWSSYPGTIYAWYNWWGSYPPNPSVSPNVDYSYALSYDPVPSLSIARSGEQGVLNTPVMSVQSSDNNPLSALNAAYKLFLYGNYTEALAAFEAVIEKYPATFAAKRALVFVEQCLERLGKVSEVPAYLNALSLRYERSPLGAFLHYRKAVGSVNLGHYTEALRQASTAIRQTEDSTDLKLALYAAGTLAYYHLGNRQTAEQYYGRLIQIFPSDALSKSALVTLGSSASQQSGRTQVAASGSMNEKQGNLVLSNHPNPFNPSTVIRFSLPEAGNVRLKVFDLLGREVAALLNEHREAGTHQVHFDARALPSGMYFYRLESGGRVVVQKMVLAR